MLYRTIDNFANFAIPLNGFADLIWFNYFQLIYSQVTTIFQNSVTFSEPTEEEQAEEAKAASEGIFLEDVAKWRREKLRYLLKYCRWLALTA